jgi:hypothetical protein
VTADKTLFPDVVGFFEALLNVAEVVFHTGVYVVLEARMVVELGGPLSEGFLGREDGREFLILDFDKPYRALRRLFIDGCNRCDLR